MAEAILTSQNYSLSALINLIYPIGSIYLSVNSTSPQQLFGGEWEQIKDKFLLSAGDTYSSGSEGGEAAHTLTVAEMPNHAHASGVSGSEAVGVMDGNSQAKTQFDRNYGYTSYTAAQQHAAVHRRVCVEKNRINLLFLITL